MKKIIFIVLTLAVQLCVHSQESSVGISGGYTTNGIGILGNYNHSLNRQSYLQGGIYFSLAEDEQNGVKIPYNDVSLNIGYFYNVTTSRNERFILSLGGGGVIGYEKIDVSEDNQLSTGALLNAESKFIYGGYIGTEIDLFISDVVSIYVVANQYYHIDSDLGNGVFYGGAGLRYHIF